MSLFDSFVKGVKGLFGVKDDVSEFTKQIAKALADFGVCSPTFEVHSPQNSPSSDIYVHYEQMSLLFFEFDEGNKKK